MDMNLNEKVAKYIRSTGKSEDDVYNSLSNLRKLSRDAYLNDETYGRDAYRTFEDDDTVSKEDLINIFSGDLGVNQDTIKDDVSILFDILNYSDNGVDNHLTVDELSVILDKENSMSSFSTFNKMYNFEVEGTKKAISDQNEEATKGKSKTSDASSSDSSSSSVDTQLVNDYAKKIASGEMTMDQLKTKLGENSDLYKEVVKKADSIKAEGTTTTETATVDAINYASSYSVSDQALVNTQTTTIDSKLASAIDAQCGSGFCAKVEKIAKNLNCNPNDLLAMMYSESGLDPKAGNSSGYVGLIQFSPKYYDTNNIRNMSAMQQLDLVEKTIMQTKSWALGSTSAPLDAGTLYSLIFLPAYAKNEVLIRNGDAKGYYKSNSALDIDKNGDISKTDLSKRIANKYQELYKSKVR